MRGNIMSLKRIMALLGAIAVVLLGMYMALLGARGPGDIQVHSGPLVIQKGATDPDFGITVNSPILIRNVQMYQYIEDGDGIRKSFSSYHEPDVETELLTFSNPEFPAEPREALFFGEVAIGEDELLLSNELVGKFALDAYIYFRDQPPKSLVEVRGHDEVFGLEPVSRHYYASSAGKPWRIGDVRVRWFAVNPANFAPLYTVAGTVQDGIIGDYDQVANLYDREIDLATVTEEFGTGNFWTGIILIVVGVVGAFFVLLPTIKEKG